MTEPADGLQFKLRNLDESDAPLYKRYPRQNKPQPAYVSLEADGTVRADYNGEIGNAVPMDVWHNRTIRTPVPCEVRADALKAYLLGEGRAHLATMYAGHTVRWDGNNRVGELDEAAMNARAALEAGLKDLDTWTVWPAHEWLWSAHPGNPGLLWPDASEDLPALIAQWEKDAEDEGLWIDGDLEEAFTTTAAACVRDGKACPEHIPRYLLAQGIIDQQDFDDWAAENLEEATPATTGPGV